MNNYVERLNGIREHASLDWLTPSQKSTYQGLLERLKFLDEVNLFGAHGTGKTFVGWILQKMGIAEYVPILCQAEFATTRTTIVVDNCMPSRIDVRETMRCCRNLGYKKIIIVTVEPAHDQIASCELSLTDSDVEKALGNLASIGVRPNSGQSLANLWHVVSLLELRA